MVNFSFGDLNIDKKVRKRFFLIKADEDRKQKHKDQPFSRNLPDSSAEWG